MPHRDSSTCVRRSTEVSFVGLICRSVPLYLYLFLHTFTRHTALQLTSLLSVSFVSHFRYIFFCCFLTYIFTPNHTFSTCASARWPQTHAATQTFSYNFFFDFHMSLSTYFNIPRRSSPICARRDARRPKYNRATQNLFCRSLWDIFTTLLTYIYILHRSFSTCARRLTTEKQWRNLKPFVKRDSIWYNFFLL